eukprot:jgi/Tetstr1/424203/TSEL_014809.t1
MCVPYQQFKQHVATGPSGMRHEYFRCLMGEYAPASGPAAVRAMSEVASMYLQGRLPGWFNWLFASARLVAPVKKLGESGAPDVRPVAVGEAERRATELAVVDNIKEAYVSVLAPSQLGFGVSAGDSMLIHGVRLIVEKLGPRAVIVHTDLRNAYNEALCRAIIQCHIDCSPLHPVIPALIASLSTDSYLVVDDRSAPLRSEDGVQKGAPLATTSLCVVTHPETSVGLEMRFDKMQADNAGMKAARREAPADIEWPEPDDHHGIPVLNVSLGGLPEYVHAYMRGKAEELRDEGPGIRRMSTVRDAAFIDYMNAILPMFLTRNSGTNTSTPGFFDPQLGSVLGRGSFNATSSARWYGHFLNDARGSSGSYAAAMREAWGRLQAATAGHLSDADA